MNLAPGIFCEVVLLRRNGMRLRQQDLAEPVRGLVRTQWLTSSSFGRPIMTADLVVPSGVAAYRSVLQSLLDVRLEAITAGYIALAGTELMTVDGRMFEYRQVWRCTPITGQSEDE